MRVEGERVGRREREVVLRRGRRAWEGEMKTGKKITENSVNKINKNGRKGCIDEKCVIENGRQCEDK